MNLRLSLLCLLTLALTACSDTDNGGGAATTDAAVGPDLPNVPGACTSDDDCMGEGVDLCSGGYMCDEGACVPDGSGPVTCEGDNPDDCLESACDPSTGACVNNILVNGTPCVHEDACLEGTKCMAGECTGGELVDCDDDNECTIDICVPGEGCEHQINAGQPCDDGDPCTSGDNCEGATCVGGQNNCGNCGDLFCSLDEDCQTCPVDCGECEGVCGDGNCDSGEETSCPQDCVGGGACGDGVCDLGEQLTCPQDCEGQGGCGDGVCDLGEQLTCPEDCEDQGGGGCGDGVCDLGEQFLCPEDCEDSGPSCGPAILCDGVCDAFLDSFACPDDCCGNDACDDFEDEECCYADCGPEVICGDDLCDEMGGETIETCPEDCEEEPVADEAPDAGSTEDADVVDEEVIEQDAADDIGPAEDAATEDAATEDTVTEDAAPTEDAATEDTVTEDAAPTEDAATEDTVTEDAAPTEDAATEDTVTED
ncbi:MAG: hypothetical protein CL940_05605, partial [Deltaproteobacteria bacterium]|nr:hypothetical protein [Deltaproteobacteria bacterium]